MKTSIISTALLAAGLACTTIAAVAAPTTDPTGDFLPSFTGSKNGDLDVVSSFVNYNPGSDLFTFSGTMNAPIGTTPGGFYVWGVNRGAGTVGFPTLASAVVFDSVVILRSTGAGSVSVTGGTGGGTLSAGTVLIAGKTISATFSGSLLGSTGFAESNYTWNLWPRDLTQTGLAAISDFAPDNANINVAVVPEPSTYALFGVGLGALGLRAAKRRRR